MSFTIYLVEDDINLNKILTSYLENEGWQVKSILNGLDAKNLIKNQPDLWILDIMLPDIDGYQIIREIKDYNDKIPVIFISARDADMDRVIGLEFGSEDYLPKPFLPRELVIRVKNILNRVYGDSHNHQDLLDFQSYNINVAARTVALDKTKIDLTSKEYSLLLYLIDNINRALSREQILTHVWGDDYFGSDRVVDDLVRRLRLKMDRLNIKTIYGYGYMVTEDED